MPRAKSFTKNYLRSYPAPASGRIELADHRVPGLVCRITAGGCRAFYVTKWSGSRTERIKIGNLADKHWSIEAARAKAQKLLAEFAEGRNPAESRRAVRDESTLAELWTRYVSEHARPHKKASSLRADEWLYGRYFLAWANRKLSSIHCGDVRERHLTIGQTSPYGANAAMRLLRSMLNKARQWGWEGQNPVTGLHWFKELSRERFLQPGELPRFFQALATSGEDFSDFVLVALLTGARRSNVQAMSWCHVDLESATWHIPPSEAKGGRPLSVVLSAHAVSILRRRKEAVKALESEVAKPWAGRRKKPSAREARRRVLAQERLKAARVFVFPGRGASGHYVEPKKAWASLLERAGLTDLRLHDLRRSLGSWQAGLGHNLAVIQKSLGHSDISTTMIYSRINLDPVRHAVEEANTAMLAAGGVGTPADVVSIRDARGRRRR